MSIYHPTRGILAEKCRFCGRDAEMAEMFHDDGHQPETCPICDPRRCRGTGRALVTHAKACEQAAIEAEREAFADLFAD